MAEKPEDDLLFREIDEELRQDQFQKLWRTYGKYVTGGAVALVLAVAGIQGWRAYDAAERNRAGERFQAALALAAEDQPESALGAFADIARQGGGYGVLARFREARILARRGDTAGAAQAYRRLAEDDAVDPLLRNMAVVYGALHELNLPDADVAAIGRRIRPLTADANPLRYSAREITGLLAHGAGDAGEAEKVFRALAADNGAPQGVRQRAQEMLSILGRP